MLNLNPPVFGLVRIQPLFHLPLPLIRRGVSGQAEVRSSSAKKEEEKTSQVPSPHHVRSALVDGLYIPRRVTWGIVRWLGTISEHSNSFSFR
ncbi:hypothetical protein V6N13_015552 [Hibiscus sabdariffa]